MKAGLRALLCELIKSDCALNNLLSRCRWGTQCSALSRPVKSMCWQFIVRYPHQKHTQEEKNIIWYPIPNVAYETLSASGRSFHWGTVCFCWGPLLWRRYGTKLSNKSIDSTYTISFFGVVDEPSLWCRAVKDPTAKPKPKPKAAGVPAAKTALLLSQLPRLPRTTVEGLEEAEEAEEETPASKRKTRRKKW